MARLNLDKADIPKARYVLNEMCKRDFVEIWQNLERAKSTDAVRDMSFGRMMLSIPDDHRAVLALIYPDIDSKDAKTRTKAWLKLMKDEITLPYRLNAKESGGNTKGKSITFGV